MRTNATGANLNREWAPTGSYHAPTLERSPEAYYVLNETIKLGCDLFLDIHGDEAIPHNFLTSMMGNPRWGERLQRLETMIKTYWKSVCILLYCLMIIILMQCYIFLIIHRLIQISKQNTIMDQSYQEKLTLLYVQRKCKLLYK